MELKKNIFLINSNFLRKIIKQISETKLEKKLSSNQIEIVNKILVKKVTNLNELFFLGIFMLTLILNLLNLFRSNAYYLSNLNIFYKLKNFYTKLIIFIVCAEIL